MTELKKKFRGPQHKLATSEDLESLAQESILLKYEDVLPEKVRSNCLEYATEKRYNVYGVPEVYQGPGGVGLSKNKAFPAFAKSKFCVDGRTNMHHAHHGRLSCLEH